MVRRYSGIGISFPPSEYAAACARRCRHLLVRRFDRVAGRRLHLHSLGGLQHVDYDLPGAFSYEGFLRTVLALELDYPTFEEAYRRAVFNIVAVNQDDHVKNPSFLMDERGIWRLSPAYDLTYARGRGYTRMHQMTLGGKRDGFTRKDLIACGAKMGINKNGAHVVQQVMDAIDRWADHARHVGIPENQIAAIGSAFRRD